MDNNQHVKRILFFLLSLFPFLLFAQTHNGGFRLGTQQEVDSIGQYLSDNGIRKLTGSLWIGLLPTQVGQRSDITDLSPLSSLEAIGGLVVEKNAQLSDLQGLHNLDTIGGGRFWIYDNDSITSIAALQGAVFTQLYGVYADVRVVNCPLLTSLDGMEGITVIGGDAGQLRIVNCTSLSSIEGLKNLEFVGDLTWIDSTSVHSLNGLEKFRSPGRLSVSGNHLLTDISALTDLDTLKDISMRDLSILRDISPLDGLFLTRGSPYFQNCPLVQRLPFFQFQDNWCQGFELLEMDQLSDISGFHSLDSMPGWNVRIRNCESLSHFSMPHLKSLGALYIENNDNLISFELPELDSLLRLYVTDNLNLDHISEPDLIRSFIVLEIINNPALQTIQGFNALRKIEDGISLKFNTSLVKISGFNSLYSIGYDDGFSGNGSFYTWANRLDTLAGFNQLKYAYGGLIFQHNTGQLILPAFDSLAYTWGIYFKNNQNLQEVKGFSNLKKAGRFDFISNPSLTSIDIFHQLDSLYPRTPINLHSNPLLRSFKGFDQLKYVGDLIRVSDNPMLSDCSALCNIIESMGDLPPMEVYGNASPCDSEPDIESYCDSLRTPVQQVSELPLKIWPSPASEVIFIDPPTRTAPLSWTIFNAAGQSSKTGLFRSALSTTTIPVADLLPGVYFLEVHDEQGNRQIEKFIVAQ